MWTNAKNGIAQSPNYDAYIGDYSSKQIPIKINMTDEDDSLVLNAAGQPSVPLVDKGNGKFALEEAALTIQFSEDKNGFVLSVNGQSFGFAKDPK